MLKLILHTNISVDHSDDVLLPMSSIVGGTFMIMLQTRLKAKKSSLNLGDICDPNTGHITNSNMDNELTRNGLY